MLNYEVDSKLLNDYVPAGTLLDSFDGKTCVSLVGFQFRHTKLFGSLPIPIHADFDEVNLRFYVRRKEGNDERRGVVFITEIVPNWAVAQVARVAYGENYICLPMRLVGSRTGAVLLRFGLAGAPRFLLCLKPQEPNREPVSSPRHFKPIVPISSNGLTCSLPIKGYVTYSGWLNFRQ